MCSLNSFTVNYIKKKITLQTTAKLSMGLNNKEKEVILHCTKIHLPET